VENFAALHLHLSLPYTSHIPHTFHLSHFTFHISHFTLPTIACSKSWTCGIDSRLAGHGVGALTLRTSSLASAIRLPEILKSQRSAIVNSETSTES
jgi:hypothetical protein